MKIWRITRIRKVSQDLQNPDTRIELGFEILPTCIQTFNMLETNSVLGSRWVYSCNHPRRGSSHTSLFLIFCLLPQHIPHPLSATLPNIEQFFHCDETRPLLLLPRKAISSHHRNLTQWEDIIKMPICLPSSSVWARNLRISNYALYRGTSLLIFALNFKLHVSY